MCTVAIIVLILPWVNIDDGYFYNFHRLHCQREANVGSTVQHNGRYTLACYSYNSVSSYHIGFIEEIGEHLYTCVYRCLP